MKHLINKFWMLALAVSMPVLQAQEVDLKLKVSTTAGFASPGFFKHESDVFTLMSYATLPTSYTLTNLGTVTVQNAQIVYELISDTLSPNAGIAIGDPVAIASITPGQSIKAAHTLTFPSSPLAMNATYFVRARVVHSGLAEEVNKSDNRSALWIDFMWYKPLKVRMIKNIDVNFENLELNATTFSPGSQLTAYLTVSNSGLEEAQDLINYTIVDNLGRSYFNSNEMTAIKSPRVITKQFTLPNQLSDGVYYLTASFSTASEDWTPRNNTITMKFIVVTVTATDDHELANTTDVYPNPSTGLLHLSNPLKEAIDVEVYNAHEQLVHTEAGVKEHVDLRALPEGMYVVKLKKDKDPLSVHKIFIQK